MTAWRWFGSLLMVAPLAAWQLPSLDAQGDKDKKQDDKKEVKKDDKDKKDDKKPDDKKPDDKKPDDKKPSTSVPKFEFKAFSAGANPFYQELETSTTQIMKVMGQSVTQKQDQTFYISWTPGKEKDKDGNVTVVEKIIGVKMNIDIGGNKITYDSTDKNQAANPMADFFNALKTLELTLVIDPKTMTIKEVKGREDFIKKLGDTNPQMKPLLTNILSDDAIKQMAQPTWGAVPRDEKATWTEKNKLPLGAIGTYETTFDYNYEGPETTGDYKGKEKIGIKSTLEYIAPKEKGELPFQIKSDSKLTSKEGKGVAYFDKDKGRIEYSKMEMKINGDLKIEVGGVDTTVELTQDQKSIVKTFDNNPLEKK